MWSRLVCLRTLVAFIFLAFVAVPVGAQEESPAEAEAMLVWQMDAVRDGDFERFVERGNKAFKELVDRFFFENHQMSWGRKAAKGYSLEYLGSVRRVGMRQHLWTVTFTGDRYEHLGSVTLAGGKVVGFDLD